MINDDKLISIGITCFREGEWLKECWQSVLAQTDSRWEAIMILDGGADEATRKIFEGISHPNLRKFDLQKNSGPYLCRTLAILNSKTEWYAHLDGDDLLPTEAVALIIEAIKGSPHAEFVFGNALYFDGDTEKLRYFDEFNVDNLVWSPSIMGISPIRKRLFFQLGGFAPELLQGGADWDFWISVAERQINGCSANGLIYKRRQRSESVGDKRRFTRDKVAQIVISRHPVFFGVYDRRSRCLGKNYELVARSFREIGDKKKAAEFANKAIELGYETSTMQEILRENKMNPLRFALRRLGRKLD